MATMDDWLRSLMPNVGASAPYGASGYPDNLPNMASTPPGGGLMGMQGATPGGPSMGYPMFSISAPQHNWGPRHAGGSPSGPIIPGPLSNPLGSSVTVDAQNPPAGPVGNPGNLLSGPGGVSSFPAATSPMGYPAQSGPGAYPIPGAPPWTEANAPAGNASAPPSPSLGSAKKGTITHAPLPPPRPKSPNLGRYPAPPQDNSAFSLVNPWTGSGQQVTALDFSRLGRKQT
jgi:hypothetical protein